MTNQHPSDTKLTPSFLHRHFPRLYGTLAWIAAPFIPNPDLKAQLVTERAQKELLEKKCASLKYDYEKANTDAWQAQRELELEKKRAELYLKQRDGFQEQTTDSFQRRETAYKFLNESTKLQLEELHEKAATYQRRCHDLEQRVQQTPSEIVTLRHALRSLQRDLELRELLFPTDPDDFNYLAAIQFYPPTQDTPLNKDTQEALHHLLVHPQKSQHYQTATYTLAAEVVQKFPTIATSLYDLLLNTLQLERPLSLQIIRSSTQLKLKDITQNISTKQTESIEKIVTELILIENYHYNEPPSEEINKIYAENMGENTQLLFLRGTYALKKNEYDLARSYSTTALKQDSSQIEYIKSIAQIHLRQNSIRNAQTILEAILFYIKDVKDIEQKTKEYAYITNMHPSIIENIKKDKQLFKDYFDLSFHLQFERDYAQRINNKGKAQHYAELAYTLNPSEDNKKLLQQLSSPK